MLGFAPQSPARAQCRFGTRWLSLGAQNHITHAHSSQDLVRVVPSEAQPLLGREHRCHPFPLGR